MKAEQKGGFFLPGLTLLLVYLKATGQIALDWVWVFAPLWVPLAVVSIILLVLFVMLGKSLKDLKNLQKKKPVVDKTVEDILDKVFDETKTKGKGH